MRLANLPMQPFCLALHVFYDDGVQFAEGGGVLQNLPRGVSVVMHLDDILVADDQQAIALGAVQNAVVDGVLVEVVAFDLKLGIKLIFHAKHLLTSTQNFQTNC